MAGTDVSSEKLRRHFESTYLSLRIGIAAIGAALPVALWVGALLLEGSSLQNSMSAYYYTGMRDVFVGALFALGVALYLYKGFSTAENVVLSVGGVLAVLVALFPTQAGAERTPANVVHAVAAILFFGCLAYVSVFRAADTLSLIRDTRRARALQGTYRALGVAMLASPLVALVAERVLRPRGGEPSLVFYVEVAGVWAFAAFWLVKSWELRQTSADRAASQGHPRAFAGARAGARAGAAGADRAARPERRGAAPRPRVRRRRCEPTGRVECRQHGVGGGPTIMRTLIVCNIVSLDGCYSGPGGDVMAMPFDAGFSDYNAERLRSADTLLLGRKSFEGFRSYWPGVADDTSQPPVEREISRLNTAMQKVVVSDRLTPADVDGWGPARVVRRADAHAEVAALKAGPGRDILVFGSHVLWNDLLAAGLVDELHLMIGSGVVGDGVRAFEGRFPGSLRLEETRRFEASSLLLVRYAVER